MREQQRAQVYGGFPGFAAVVEHEEENQRQSVACPELVRLDDILPEQGGIGKDANGHPHRDDEYRGAKR